MKYFISQSNNPYFNIALEEFLLKHKDDELFMLWRSDPSIIIGKHQNAYAEINYQFAKKNKIDIIRRLSGGGTVFHDKGNLNFTIIQKGEPGKLIDFEKHTLPIRQFLEQLLGKPVEMVRRNSLLVNGKKISGNAEHIYKNKVLHHGTLLFNSDLEILSDALKVNPLLYKDKSVKSVRSIVTNISELLKNEMSFDEFQTQLLYYLKDYYASTESIILEKNDLNTIHELIEEKYSTEKWNYGYSPKYFFTKLYKQDAILIQIHIYVEKGRIIECRLDGPDELSNDLLNISDALTGQKHIETQIIETLEKNNFVDFFSKVLFDEFVISLF